MQVEAWLQRAANSAPTVTALQTPDARLSHAELWQAARPGVGELAERGACPAGIACVFPARRRRGSGGPAPHRRRAYADRCGGERARRGAVAHLPGRPV